MGVRISWPLLFLVTVVFLTGQSDVKKPGVNQAAIQALQNKPGGIYEADNPYLVPPVNAPINQTGQDPNQNMTRVYTTPIGTNSGIDPGQGLNSAVPGWTYGKDVNITGVNHSWMNNCISSDLATDYRGYIYVIYQYYDTTVSHQAIQVERSIDKGATWAGFGYINNSSYDVTDPTICVVYDYGNPGTNYKLVYAYIIHDTVNQNTVQVATQEITDTAFHSPVTHAVPRWVNRPYSKPKIWTDSPNYSSPWVYLVAEEQANWNILNYWRSTDYGVTWPDDSTHRSDLYISTDSLVQPDGCSGYSDLQWVTGYDETTKTIYTFSIVPNTLTVASKAIITFGTAPNMSTTPKIVASNNFQKLMLVYTHYFASGDDDINYCYSANNGTNWYGGYWMPGGASEAVEFAPKLGMSYGGTGSYHLAFNRDWDVRYCRRALDFSTTLDWTESRVVDDTAGWASEAAPNKGVACIQSSDTPLVSWADFSSTYYDIHFDRGYATDLVGTWDGQGVYFRNSETAVWNVMGSPATQIVVGDLDGDGTGDLIGIWPSQGGVWVKYSSTGAWANLGSTADWIAAADMNGDGKDELVGSWSGQGVYWRNNTSGAWTLMATPATKITAGDLDHDGIADLIGIWPSQGGVWVKYSSTGSWAYLGSTADWIGVGDMNGDGYSELLGTWSGQGVYWRNSSNGAWTLLATPASQIVAGDLNGDWTDDLIGIWPSQGGVWAKSSTGVWSMLGSTPRWITTGTMRGGTHPWANSVSSLALMGPFGGGWEIPHGINLSDKGPGGKNFIFKQENNLVPTASMTTLGTVPGPGMPGFVCTVSANLTPGSKATPQATTRENDPPRARRR